MSEADLYALAWVAVLTLNIGVAGWILADAGLDPARIPIVGPIFERTWNALTRAMRKLLHIKDHS
ncbi:hypothetical protein DEJ17_06310 [Curtobacterium sp. MCSS17_011]|uniref:hypothetical protein n=1 Tax=Curtobacterium sp. MCSS17_011 TaxID=2175643 RepID=UPI000D8EF5E7|nr:hypothetical protein [Curtobacterium sp. MCSS17_011]PYY59978.1 hypothetical protein DEJ17_06310 [Curtobacterium sp. MCSS17_011]